MQEQSIKDGTNESLTQPTISDQPKPTNGVSNQDIKQNIPKRASKHKSNISADHRVDFVLDSVHGELPEYNALMDRHLNPLFSRQTFRKLLLKNGLITKEGEILEKKTNSIIDSKSRNDDEKSGRRKGNTSLLTTTKLPPILKNHSKSSLETPKITTCDIKKPMLKATIGVEEMYPYARKCPKNPVEYFIPRVKKRKKQPPKLDSSDSDIGKNHSSSALTSPKSVGKLKPLTKEELEKIFSKYKANIEKALKPYRDILEPKVIIEEPSTKREDEPERPQV